MGTGESCGWRAGGFSSCARPQSPSAVGFGTVLEGGPAACLGAGGFMQFKMKEAEALVEVM